MGIKLLGLGESIISWKKRANSTSNINTRMSQSRNINDWIAENIQICQKKID